MSVRYSGAVRFGELVRVHARTARRQRSLWYATVPLTLLAVLLSVDAPAAPGTGGIDDLVFVARVMGTLIGIAYAAAFTGLLVAPARLGVDELELSTPVGTTTLGAARVLGTFAVVMVPPLVVLVGVGLVQTVGGSWTGLPAALLVAVAMEVPTVLCALAVSALAGSVLPQALARVVAVLTWLYLTMTTPTIPVPGVTGTVLGSSERASPPWSHPASSGLAGRWPPPRGRSWPPCPCCGSSPWSLPAWWSARGWPGAHAAEGPGARGPRARARTALTSSTRRGRRAPEPGARPGPLPPSCLRATRVRAQARLGLRTRPPDHTSN